MLSSLHEEVSIFIDNDWFVFATLSRDLVCNIAADAKDTTLKFEIPSKVQDTCDAIFSPKLAWIAFFLSMRVRITMHVLARLCAEYEKEVSKKFGGIVSKTFVDVSKSSLCFFFASRILWCGGWTLPFLPCHCQRLKTKASAASGGMQLIKPSGQRRDELVNETPPEQVVQRGGTTSTQPTVARSGLWRMSETHAQHQMLCQTRSWNSDPGVRSHRLRHVLQCLSWNY